MKSLEKISSTINLPAKVWESAEKIIVALFGKATNEIGEIFSDKVRYIRLGHSLKILSKVNDKLDKKGLSPSQIDLKYLVPILQNSSLENDPKIQLKWANLIANFSFDSENKIPNKKFLIDILTHLSVEEVKLLDLTFNSFLEKEKQLLLEWSNTDHIKNRTRIYVENANFSMIQLRKELKVDPFTLSCMIENLDSLGIIRIINREFYGGELNKWNEFQLTNKGLNFVKTCKDV